MKDKYLICNNKNCNNKAVYYHKGMHIYLCDECAKIFEWGNFELIEERNLFNKIKEK